LILAILIAGTFASCSNLSLDTLFINQFKEAGLGQVSAEAIADAPAEDLIDESGIAVGQVAESFFEALAADAAAGGTLTEDTLDKLDALMTPEAIAAAPELAQAAVALAIQINLKEVQADEIINNAPAAIALFTDPDFSITDPDDLQAFFDLLIPADLGKASFTDDQLAGIRDVVDRLTSPRMMAYFDSLGASLDANEGVFKPGLDSGSLAQVVLIAKVMNMIEPKYPVGNPTLGESIAALLDNLPEDGNTDFNPDIYIDTTNLMDNLQDVFEDPALNTLLAAAGIDLQSLIDQFMNE
jgi:hypothetical protein